MMDMSLGPPGPGCDPIAIPMTCGHSVRNGVQGTFCIDHQPVTQAAAMKRTRIRFAREIYNSISGGRRLSTLVMLRGEES